MTPDKVTVIGAGLAGAGFLFAIAAGAGVSGTSASGGGPPTVVELFTSQGCSSCPPADALLTELAQRPDVVALAFHVDYWDHLGWHDPFAAAWATRRQQGYRDTLSLPYVYTPQMVVDGRNDVVGSRREAVMRQLDGSRADASARVAVSLGRVGPDRLRIRIGGAGSTPGPATVLLVAIDPHHRTEVRNGENSGRTLAESQVVRAVAVAGLWQGEPLSLDADAPLPAAGRNWAVLLQRIDGDGRPGPILGAARLDPD